MPDVKTPLRIQNAADFAHALVLADVGKAVVVKTDLTGFELASLDGRNAATLEGHAASYFLPAGSFNPAAFAAAAHTHSYQPVDVELTALAGLTSAADKVPYFTGAGAASLADFTAFGRSLAAAADAAAGRTALALGTMATQAAASYAALATINTFALAQTFTSSIIAIAGARPPADDSAWKFVTRADGTTAVITVNTVNNRVRMEQLGVGIDAAAAYTGFFFRGSTGSSNAAIRGEASLLGNHLNFAGGYFQVNLSTAYSAGVSFLPSALRSFVYHNSGSQAIGDAAAFYSTGQQDGGTITNYYGNYLGNLVRNAGTLTTQYGLYVEALTAGTNNIAIYTNAGDIRLMASGSDKIGFHGATPIARSTGWAASNVIPDKVFDANATTLDELADVVGTLITWLISRGDLAA